MRTLSYYKGEEAIELWADLLEPMSSIVTDKDVLSAITSKKPPVVIARAMLKDHVKDVESILLRVDPEPLDGLNIIVRLVAFIMEMMNDPDLKVFFGFAGPEVTAKESSGSATESTEEEEH